MPEESNVSWFRAILLALSATALGAAIQIHRGELGPSPYPTIILLTLSITLAGLAIFASVSLPGGKRVFQIVTTLCLVVNFLQIATKSPDPLLAINTFSKLAPFLGALVSMALLCGVVQTADGLTRAVAFAGVLVTFAFIGNWDLVHCPDPQIDVYIFQKDSAAALAEGRDPYALTFPNIYTAKDKVYGQGVEVNGRLQFGYPYFPAPLFAIMPATLLHLDLRYSQLAAMIATAIVIVRMSPTSRGFAAALLFLTTPRFLFVLQQSWTEPFTVLALALTVACTLRRSRLLPLALGIFLASKQYVPVAAMLCFVYPRPARQTMVLLLKAIAVAAAISVPMALWNFPAFWHSVVTLQFRQPFRPESLSYLAWVGEAFWSRGIIVALPFTALLLASGLVLWRRDLIGFSAAVAFCFLLFFAFNKQAFANYYFFVIGAMCCAMAELEPQISFAPCAPPAFPIYHPKSGPG